MKRLMQNFLLTGIFFSALKAFAQYGGGQGFSMNPPQQEERQPAQQQESVVVDSSGKDKEEAYKAVEESLSPLTMDQISRVKDLYKKVNRASILEDVPPTPTFSSLAVDLQPGAVPPVIRLSAGLVSSLVFVDTTGAAWPIRAYDVGDAANFNIVWNQNGDDPTSMTNTLLIQPMSLYKDGNLAVMLQGLNTPVMLSLIPGQQAVDYRVDIQVPGYGPFAKPEDSIISSASHPALNSVINNITPEGSKPLKISGGQARAWLFGDVMYVRTPQTLVSPAWTATVRGASGTVSAYEIPKTPVILVMDNGRIRELKVEGF